MWGARIFCVLFLATANIVNAQNPLCPRDGIKYPDTSGDCSAYFVCIGGKMVRQHCETGLNYNCEEKICVKMDHCCATGGPTTSRTTSTTTTTQATSTSTEATITTAEITKEDVPTTATTIKVTSLSTPRDEETTTENGKSPYCPQDGIKLPIAGKCSSYYQCVNGQPQEFNCPMGQSYNCITKLCSYNIFTPCCRNSSTGSEAPVYRCLFNGLKIPNPFTCDKYFECENFRIVEKTCPSGEKYHWLSGKCGEATHGACAPGSGPEITTQTTITTNEPNSPLCPQNGIKLPDPQNCKNYFQCTNGQLERKTCFPGFVYNCFLKICTLRVFAPCCKDDPNHSSSNSDSNCLINGIKIPNPFTCNKYFECVDHKIVEKGCAIGEKYDWIRNYCVPATSCECAPGTNGNHSTNNPLCSMDGLKYPSTTDCGGYMECENGNLIQKKCPQGENYNCRLEKCEYQEKPHCCSGGVTATTSTGEEVTTKAGIEITTGNAGDLTTGSGSEITTGNTGDVTTGTGGDVTTGSGGEPSTTGSGSDITTGNTEGGDTTSSSGIEVTTTGGDVTSGSGSEITTGNTGDVTTGTGGDVTTGSGGEPSTTGSGSETTTGNTEGGDTTTSSGVEVTTTGGDVTSGSGSEITTGNTGDVTTGTGGDVTTGNPEGEDTTTSSGVEVTTTGGDVTSGSGSEVTGGDVTTGSGGEPSTTGSGSEITTGNTEGGDTTTSSGVEVTTTGGDVTSGSGSEITTGNTGDVTTGTGGDVTTGSGGEPSTTESGSEITTGNTEGGDITTSSGIEVTTTGGDVTSGSDSEITTGSTGDVTTGTGGDVTTGSVGELSTTGSGSEITTVNTGDVTTGTGGDVTTGPGGEPSTTGSSSEITTGNTEGGDTTTSSGVEVTTSGEDVTSGSSSEVTGGDVTTGSGGEPSTTGSGSEITTGNTGDVTTGTGGDVTTGPGGEPSTTGSSSEISTGNTEGGDTTTSSGVEVTTTGGDVTSGSGSEVTGGDVTTGSGGEPSTTGSGSEITTGNTEGGDTTTSSGVEVTTTGGDVTSGSGSEITTGNTGDVTTGTGGDVTTGLGGEPSTTGSGSETTTANTEGEDTTTSSGVEVTTTGGDVTSGSDSEITTVNTGDVTTGTGGDVTTGSSGELSTTASGSEITTVNTGDVTTGIGGDVTTGSGGEPSTTGSGSEITTGSSGSGDVTTGSGAETSTTGGDITTVTGAEITTGLGGINSTIAPSLNENLCPIDGAKLPNMLDCNSYYVCENNEPVSHSCSTNEEYSCWDQKCVAATSASCITNVNSTGQSCSNSELIMPNTKDCSSYYKCVNGRVELQECESGTAYNAWFEKCVSTSLAHCQSSGSGSNNASELCPQDGITLPNVADCKSYFKCEGGQPVPHTCPFGLVYNCFTKSCSLKCFSPCCKNDPNPPNNSSHCLLSGIKIPNPFTCDKYFECYKFEIVEKQCPSGQRYDWLKMNCVDAKVGRCAPSITDNSTTTTSPETTTPTTTHSCSKNSKLPNIYECDSYYECVDGQQVNKKCPFGFVYNCWSQSCTLPFGVRHCCQNKQNDIGIQSICTANGRKTPDPYNCHNYYECSHYRVSLNSCPTGENFDAITSTCKPQDQGTCIGNLGGGPPNCTEGEVIPDYNDCQKYQSCENGQLVQKQCSNNQVWNCYSKSCSSNIFAPCCMGDPNHSKYPSQTNCISLGSKIPAFNDCSKYYQCSFFTLKEKTCVSGQSYDYEKSMCVSSSEAVCAPGSNNGAGNSTTTTESATSTTTTTTQATTTTTQATTTTTAPPTGTTKAPNPLCPKDGLRYPSSTPGDCSGYFECVNRQMVKKHCDLNINYNCRLERCDPTITHCCASRV